MASISMVVSEMAHAMGRVNNRAVRESIKLLIIQTRNEVIRRSYENHSYVDRGLTQRFRVTLKDVTDGDISIISNIDETEIVDGISMIKRTTDPVPKPVRLINNLPFDRVSTVGFKTNKEIPFVKETTARFHDALPGMCKLPRYDYINGYIYLFPAEGKSIDFQQIIIESAFENPVEIQVKNGIITEYDAMLDENEWVISEDMLGQIREIIYKRDLLNNIKETNEIPNTTKLNS